jgi:hypothetical protein
MIGGATRGRRLRIRFDRPPGTKNVERIEREREEAGWGSNFSF